MSAIAETNAMQELVIRLDLVGRFIETHGNSAGYRDEAQAICESMVKRAGELRDTLAVHKLDKTLSLDQLREALSSMALVSCVREYDRAIGDLQNLIGDEVHEHESATETPDGAGRDFLDSLEAVALRLHNVMRELCGAAAI